MNDLEYIFRKICERRGVTLSKVESMRLLMHIDFGKAAFYPLPLEAGVFYFLPKLVMFGSGVTGTPVMQFLTDSGAGSPGDSFLIRMGTSSYYYFDDQELDALQFTVGSFSAGTIYISSSGFKITTSV